jgi:hypothetical protein
MTTTSEPIETRQEEVAAEPGPSRFVLGPLVTGAVLVAWSAVHVLTGTPWQDLTAWVAAVVIGVLVPGMALVRAVRRSGAPLVEDAAWGAAAGCLVGLVGWFLDRTLPWSPGPFVWGPVLVGLLLVPRQTRRRLLARPEPGWGTGPTVAMGVVMLVALAWMTSTALLFLPVNPGSPGVLYSQDTLFQAAVVGEMRHHLVPDYPFVAGEPLRYHWFLYSILAYLTTGTGVDPFDSSLRLGPTTVLPAVLLLAGVVARRMSGQVWAAPVAMALLAVVDLSLANRWGWQGSSAIGGTYSPIIGIWRGSPPQALAWLAGLAALGTTVAWLRRSDIDRAVPVALLLPSFVLCVGTKSSQLPVLAAGIGLALLAALVHRRRDLAVRALLLLVAAGVVFQLAALLLYRGGSYGVILRPGDRLNVQATSLFPGLGTAVESSGTALLTALLIGTVPLLPRLAGLVWLSARRRDDPATWITVGACIGGFAAAYLLRHPAQSELYFLFSAYPLAVVGSACGFTMALQAYRSRPDLHLRRLVPVLALCVVLGTAAAAAVAVSQPALWPLQRWARDNPGDRSAESVPVTEQAGWYLLPLAQLLAAVALVALVVVVGSRVVSAAVARRRPGWRSVTVPVTPVVVTVLLGTGVYGMSQTIEGTDTGSLAERMDHFVSRAATDGVLPTTQDVVDGGRWLNANAQPDDVVAVNRYCVQTRAWRAGRARCDAREFSPSAFSERRTYVGGWAYADRNLALAWITPPPYRKIPFWDQPRLDRQEAAFRRPTADLLAALYGNGVRWLWADVRDGPVATDQLDRLADLRYSGPNLRIWQMRSPTR